MCKAGVFLFPLLRSLALQFGMPELPEVETIVRDLRAQVVGKVIRRASYLHWAKTFVDAGPQGFAKQVTGKKITAVERRAKRIVFSLGRDVRMVVSLRMTGQLYYLESSRPTAASTRFVLDLGKGELRFDDARKFGRVWLFSPADWAEDSARAGPEPLEMTEDAFVNHFAARRGMLKPSLLNQKIIAGIGNIYADEALWLARLHPRRRLEGLTRSQLAALYQGVQTALRSAIENRGTSFDDYRDGRGEKGANQEKLHVYGRKGLPCHRCGSAIEKMVSGQRGTHYCSVCQKAPRRLGVIRHIH